MEPATRYTLKDLIDYQEGAVVSKTVIKKETGAVTLFSFDKGQGLSEHTAPFDAIAHIVEGEAQIVIDGNQYAVKAGEIIMMPANHPHAVKAVTPFKMLLIMVKS